MKWNQSIADRIEQSARASGLFAVPLLLGYLGNAVQSHIAKESIKRDHVQIALNVLQARKQLDDEGLTSKPA